MNEFAGRASMINLKLPSFLPTEKHAYFAHALVCHSNESEFQKLSNEFDIGPAISFKHNIKIRLDGSQFGIVISHTLMITRQTEKVLRWQTILKTKAII